MVAEMLQKFYIFHFYIQHFLSKKKYKLILIEKNICKIKILSFKENILLLQVAVLYWTVSCHLIEAT